MQAWLWNANHQLLHLLRGVGQNERVRSRVAEVRCRVLNKTPKDCNKANFFWKMELWYRGTFASQTTCSAAFQLEEPGINLSRLLIPSLLLET